MHAGRTSQRAGPQGMSVLTRAMRDDSGPSDFADPFLFNQPQHRVECASDLERPDLLEVLCFEEQLDLRLCRLLALPWRSL